ncbi:MAG: hypothetical protein COB60_05180 [Flavobacteriaceae bacterium]|nr:MAG: hypothetical protein COB60_05180 [Flavobacteriaceae bacterium]
MKLQQLNIQTNSLQNEGLIKETNKMNALIAALEAKEVPETIISTINTQIDALNALTSTEKKIRKSFHNTHCTILKSLEKELKYVSKNHYRNLWMALGMSVFGLPLGVAFSAAIGNYGFIGIGLPIGMVIGMAYGTKLDKKAEADGLQLNITC